MAKQRLIRGEKTISAVFLLSVLGVFIIDSLAFEPTNSGRIVFDNSAGFFGPEDESSVGLSVLRDELEFTGFEVTDNIGLGVESDAVTDKLLGKSNVLVIVNPTRSFSAEEADLIENFVLNGGELLLVCDTPESAANMNKLSKKFGVKFLSYHIGYNVPVETKSGLIRLYSPMPAYIELKPVFAVNVKADATAWRSVWTKPDETVILKDNFTVFAGINYGKGRVAFMGDKDLLLNGNIATENNLNFALNLFGWLSKGGEEIAPQFSIPEEYAVTVKDGEEANVSLVLKNNGVGKNLVNVSSDSQYIIVHETSFTLYDEYPLNLTVRIPCTEEKALAGKLTFRINGTSYNTSVNINVTPRDSRLSYNPGELRFSVNKGEKGIASLLIANIGEVNQSVRLNAPDYLDIVFNENLPIGLPVGEQKLVRSTLPGSDYSSISDNIVVEHEFDCHNVTDYIPIKVVGSE